MQLEEYKQIYKQNKFSHDGLTDKAAAQSALEFGRNVLSKPKKVTVIKRITNALFEPMMIILLVAWVITTGVNLGNLFLGKDFDFLECAGILLAIGVSVGLTVIMESNLKKHSSFWMSSAIKRASAC